MHKFAVLSPISAQYGPSCFQVLVLRGNHVRDTMAIPMPWPSEVCQTISFLRSNLWCSTQDTISAIHRCAIALIRHAIHLRHIAEQASSAMEPIHHLDGVPFQVTSITVMIAPLHLYARAAVVSLETLC